MDSVSPVWTDAETPAEKIIALDQMHVYQPLVGLPVQFSDGQIGMCCRFRFTEKEKQAIANGADLIITEMTFGGLYTPLNLSVCKPETRPYD